MKISELTIGEHYLAGRNNQIKVVALRVERTTSTGSKRRDGVQVQVEESAPYSGLNKGEEVVILASHIICTWSEHQAQVEAEELKRQAKIKQHDKAQAQLDSLRASMLKSGIELEAATVGYFSGFNEPPVNLRISSQEVKKLQALFDALPEGEIELPETGSALDKLFG